MSLPRTEATLPPSRAAMARLAARAATRAAREAGVEISVLDTVTDLEQVVALVNETWPEEVSISLLRALRKAGNFVSGARRDGAVVGACIAFFGASGTTALHSHLAVTDRRSRARGIGVALKLHQRAWALQHGVPTIYWTYDPLQRRNAHVNLNKLAAVPIAYLDNFYGDHGDSGQRPFPTDRLMLEWRLGSDRVTVAGEGAHAVPDLDDLRRRGGVTLLASGSRGEPVDYPDDNAAVALVGTPVDATLLRQSHPDVALDWLHRVRHHLRRAFADGSRVSGFTRDGFYVLERSMSEKSGQGSDRPIASEQGNPS